MTIRIDQSRDHTDQSRDHTDQSHDHTDQSRDRKDQSHDRKDQSHNHNATPQQKVLTRESADEERGVGGRGGGAGLALLEDVSQAVHVQLQDVVQQGRLHRVPLVHAEGVRVEVGRLCPDRLVPILQGKHHLRRKVVKIKQGTYVVYCISVVKALEFKPQDPGFKPLAAPAG